MRCHFFLRGWEAWRNSFVGFLHSVVCPRLRALLCAQLPLPQGILFHRIKYQGCRAWLLACISCATVTAVPWVAGTSSALGLGGESCLLFFILGKIHTLVY